MFQCFLAVKSKLDRKLGLFDLLGCDFLIDEEFKVRRFTFPLTRVSVGTTPCKTSRATSSPPVGDEG